MAVMPRERVAAARVFENHDAMGVDALRSFVAEQRIPFPVGVDAPGADGDPLPRTMRAYGMQGTPRRCSSTRWGAGAGRCSTFTTTCGSVRRSARCWRSWRRRADARHCTQRQP
jgi:hypothetical protein